MENEIRGIPSPQERVQPTAVAGSRERRDPGRERNERHRRALREARRRQRAEDDLEVSDESRDAARRLLGEAPPTAGHPDEEAATEREDEKRGRRVDIRI